MNPTANPFRLNIGFILKESVGYSRTYEIEHPGIELNEDLFVENLAGSAKIDRTQKGLVLQANFTADMPAECVRCLDSFQQKVATSFTELYAFDRSTTDENELIVPEEGYIDLKPVIGEYLQIDFPSKPICKPDCQGLCQECGTNLNKHECDCEDVDIDPRLAKLQELLEKEEKNE